MNLDNISTKQQALLNQASLENPNEIWLPYKQILVSNKSRVIPINALTIIDLVANHPFNITAVITESNKKERIYKVLATVFLGYDPVRHYIQKKDINGKLHLDNIYLIEKCTNDIWMPIIDYPNYEVSNTSKVRNLKTNRLLKPWVESNNYIRYTLLRNGAEKKLLSHRLVYAAFHPDEDISDKVINHLDSNPMNNNLDNLQACSQKENVEYSYIFGNNAVLMGKIDAAYNPLLMVGSRKMIDTSSFKM